MQLTNKKKLKRATLKAPPANPRTCTFSVLKCNCRYYSQKTKICNIGGVKNKIDSYIGPRFVNKQKKVSQQGYSKDICPEIWKNKTSTDIGQRFVKKQKKSFGHKQHCRPFYFFRTFLNIFLNILTALCRVNIIIPINVGPRINRGSQYYPILLKFVLLFTSIEVVRDVCLFNDIKTRIKYLDVQINVCTYLTINYDLQIYVDVMWMK